MLTTLFLLALGTPGDVTSTPAPQRFQVELAPCAESTVLRTTWISERRSTVKTTTNGVALPPYATHEERHLDRALEVLKCRAGVPQNLRVRFGEAFVKRLDPDPEPGQEVQVGVPVYTTERSPLAGRTFDVAQVGETAEVFLSEGAPASASLAQLVLEAEAIQGGAVPLPGDAIARAIGATARVKGEPFEFDALVAREMLGGAETGTFAATFTFQGDERTPEGRTRARFDVRIVVHEETDGGLVRDADLRGSLITDPRSGRPIHFEVTGAERTLIAAADAANASEIEMDGTWHVRRTWAWR